MSTLRETLLGLSGDISREEIIENLNEDHKLILKENDLETRLRQTFTSIISEISNLEYSLNNPFPYGKMDPMKAVEQAVRNKELVKRLKKIAYCKMEELRKVIDEIFCVEEESMPAVQRVPVNVITNNDIPMFSKKVK